MSRDKCQCGLSGCYTAPEMHFPECKWSTSNLEYLRAYASQAVTINMTKNNIGWARGRRWVKESLRREAFYHVEFKYPLTEVLRGQIDALLDSVGC